MRNAIQGTGSTTRLAAAILCAVGSALCVAPAASAQSETRTVLNPARETLIKMQRSVTVDLTDQRLEDVVKFIKEFTGADIEPMWGNDQHEGLDKEMRITISIKNQPAINAVERILEKAATDLKENGWQMSDDGALQIGTKDMLNKSKKVVIYDINDLLLQIPRYDEVPNIDLQSVLQQSQGGQGSNPFKNDNDNKQNDKNKNTREDRAKEIQDILTSLVEPSQWVDNGGEAATIRYYNGTLIVNAPDYVHRQINGYTYWPSHSSQSSGGRRYVSLTTDNGIGTIDTIRKVPINATAGGAGQLPGGGGK